LKSAFLLAFSNNLHTSYSRNIGNQKTEEYMAFCTFRGTTDLEGFIPGEIWVEGTYGFLAF
jgi:hypothetical protein